LGVFRGRARERKVIGGKEKGWAGCYGRGREREGEGEGEKNGRKEL
jgi:hypothetical protein